MFKKRKPASLPTQSDGGDGNYHDASINAVSEPRKQAKIISLSISNDEEDEDVVIINRSKQKAQAKMRFTTSVDDTGHGAGTDTAVPLESGTSEYSAESIRALREATRAKESASVDLPPPVAILSGADAHELLQHGADNNMEEEEEYDVKRPPNNHESAKHLRKSAEVISVASSDEDDDSDLRTVDDDNAKRVTPLPENSVATILDDIEQVRNRLESRRGALQRDDRSSTPPPASQVDELKQALMDAKGKVRSLERVANFTKALVSCLRIKMVQLSTAEDVTRVWDDVKEEFKVPSVMVVQFAEWNNADKNEFERFAGPGVGDILVPIALTQAYASGCTLDAVSMFIAEEPNINAALDALCAGNELVRTKILDDITTAAVARYAQWT